MQKLIIKQKDILKEVQKDQRVAIESNQKLKSDISKTTLSQKQMEDENESLKRKNDLLRQKLGTAIKYLENLK